MAYTHSKYEVQLADKQGVDGAAVIGDELAIGYVPHIVRAVSVTITASPDADGQITFKHRPTVGSSSDEEVIAEVNYPSSAAAGDVIYADGLDVEVEPGESIVAEVTDASPTSGTASAAVYLEPRWEVPGNLGNMSETS